MKTSELTGAALDWAVAIAEGHDVEVARGGWLVFDSHQDDPPAGVNEYNDSKWQRYAPSSDWAQGGPIIEREGIAIDCIRCGGKVDGWIAALPLFCEAKYEIPSPTPLIAAMRCFVASKLGDEVEIPEELSHAHG